MRMLMNRICIALRGLLSPKNVLSVMSVSAATAVLSWNERKFWMFVLRLFYKLVTILLLFTSSQTIPNSRLKVRFLFLWLISVDLPGSVVFDNTLSGAAVANEVIIHIGGMLSC